MLEKQIIENFLNKLSNFINNWQSFPEFTELTSAINAVKYIKNTHDVTLPIAHFIYFGIEAQLLIEFNALLKEDIRRYDTFMQKIKEFPKSQNSQLHNL